MTTVPDSNTGSHGQRLPDRGSEIPCAIQPEIPAPFSSHPIPIRSKMPCSRTAPASVCYPRLMPDAPKTRRQMLEEFLAANPHDAFARYGLALECANAGESAAAEDHFRQLVSAHPEYVPGYYHYGQLQARIGRREDAQKTFRAGVSAA